MFKQFLQHIPGADAFMIASLAVFLLFFLGVGLYLFYADRKEMDRMASLPLQNDGDKNTHQL
jgi:cbb3-type cytochrome oxidase subunit 3